MTDVYVVQSDEEDDQSILGVYATLALAQSAFPGNWTDWTEMQSNRTEMSRQRIIHLFGKNHTSWEYLSVEKWAIQE